MKTTFCLPQANGLVKLVWHNIPKLNNTIKLVVTAHELERKTISHIFAETLRFYFIINHLLDKITWTVYFTKKSKQSKIVSNILIFTEI